MKVIQSHIFRAVVSIVVGALLLKYREQTVTWLTISIGVMFLLSGVISLATYFSARKRVDGPQLFDANGNQILGHKPMFPIVGIGSLLFGAVLALMPNTFIQSLVYILSAILVLGAIGQFINLASARKYSSIGLFYWIMPSVLLIVGLVALVHPTAIASAPLFVIGWAIILYGVVELINIMKIFTSRKKFEKENQSSTVSEATAVEIKDENETTE